tara:strand:- start:267 stop:680 length:414 start_codon:yes stop_codon:yes gene_type:complete
MPRKKTTTTKKTIAKKPAAKRKPAPKKEMQYADGKDHELKKARDIEDLISVDRKNPFRTADGSDFETSIASMSLSDMQELAVSAGIFPSGTKATLRNKILKEYRAKEIGQKRSGQVTKPSMDPSSDRAKDLIRLLNE